MKKGGRGGGGEDYKKFVDKELTYSSTANEPSPALPPKRLLEYVLGDVFPLEYNMLDVSLKVSYASQSAGS